MGGFRNRQPCTAHPHHLRNTLRGLWLPLQGPCTGSQGLADLPATNACLRVTRPPVPTSRPVRTAQLDSSRTAQLDPLAPAQSANNPAHTCPRPASTPHTCNQGAHLATTCNHRACPAHHLPAPSHHQRTAPPPHHCTPHAHPPPPASSGQNEGGPWGTLTSALQREPITSHNPKTGSPCLP